MKIAQDHGRRLIQHLVRQLPRSTLFPIVLDIILLEIQRICKIRWTRARGLCEFPWPRLCLQEGKKLACFAEQRPIS